MPKNIWITKKRKKNRKGKSSGSDAEIIDRSRVPDPNDPSISILRLSDLHQNAPVKTEEEVFYPDTRFRQSTTLFPAMGVEEKSLPLETTSQTSKRSAEDELISKMPKKGRTNDLPNSIKPITSDDCLVIENPTTRVKVEVIDLTDDPHPIAPILCSPVKTSCRENRPPEKPNTALQAVRDIRLKFESSENTSNDDNFGSAGVNYLTIQPNAEQNKESENSEVNTYVELCKNIDPTAYRLSSIQVKSENRMLRKIVNYDDIPIEQPLSNHMRIKTEKGKSNTNNTEVNSESSDISVSKDTDSTNRNIHLGLELDSENDNRVINFPIKVEQNDTVLVSDDSTSLSNFSCDVNRTDFYSVERPIKIEQNKTDQNCEVGDDFSLLLRQTTEERKKLDKIDSQSSYSSENPQNKEDILQEITYSSNISTGVELFESSIGNELIQKSISPTTDGSIFSDTQLYEPGVFRTPLLKYLNCNKKVEVREVLHTLFALRNLIENEDEINEIESMVIHNSIDQKDKSELCLDKIRKELSYLQESEKDSLKVDDILRKVPLQDFTELVNLKSNITNLDSSSASSELMKSINKIQNPLNSNGFSEEMRQNDSPSILFESYSKMSESSRMSDSDSRTIYCNSPMDIENPIEEKCPSIIFLSSSDDNERTENLNNISTEGKKNYDEFLPNDLLRQILGSATSTERSDSTDISCSLEPSVDPIAKSNTIINKSLFHNLRNIGLPKNKPVENRNFETHKNVINSERSIKNYENFSSVSVLPENVLKQSHNVLLHSPSTHEDALGNPSKRIKMSIDDSLSKSWSIKKPDYEEHKMGTSEISSLNYLPDRVGNHLGSDLSSNSPDSFPGAFNLGQNMLSPQGNLQNSSFSACSEMSLLNPGYRRLVNSSSPHDPRLQRNYSPESQRDVKSQNSLSSFNIRHTIPSQNIADVRKLSMYPFMNQITSGSTTYTMPNLSRVVLSPAELFQPTINAVQIQQVDPRLPQMNHFQPPYLNQRTSMINSHDFPSPASENISFSMAQPNPEQSINGVPDQQPFVSLLHLPGNPSTSCQYHHLVSKEISPSISRHNTLSFDNFSSESVNYGFGINPPLPVGNPPSPPPPPPSPSTPSPIIEKPHSIASNISQSSLIHTKKHAATKNIISNQSSSNYFVTKPSLLPNHLRENIGKNIIHTSDVYLIIIERNVDWINGIDKEIGIPKMSEIGGEFQQVRGSYGNHLIYYNTFFPLLLLECFSKISTALKASKQKEKKDRNICKVIQCEPKQNYVSLTSDSFIRHSDVENIPKDGHIILVKFAAIPEGNVRMLGYVTSSATRAYSHRHDHGNEILKYVNVNKRTDLIKIRINFCIVFETSDINLDVPIHISKLTSIKRALVLNDALKELQRSPLCDAILGLKNHETKSFALPRRQDTNAMTTVVQEIVGSLNTSSSQLTVVRSAPFTDSFLAIVQIVEEIQKSKIPGKILVCVRSEMLCQMGMNLIETSSNVIIINRERENVHERLHSRVLDVKISHVSKAQNMPDNVAKSMVLQEAEVLLAVTGICFYEDVQSLTRDLTYCIIHDAHSFTEPESALPLLYGIRHLLLFGDPDESCIVNSKCGASLGYNKSLFHRAYDLC